MIKTVLFDVDGVLSAHEPFSKRLARDHGITTDITAPFLAFPASCINIESYPITQASDTWLEAYRPLA